jgi:putative ABC transport system substrate-binding protein
VTNLNRPGANITGVYFFASVMEAKRLGLLREFIPNAKSVAVLLNPTYPNADNQTNEVREAARTLGLELHLLRASNDSDLETAFAQISRLQPGGLLICADPYFNSQRVNIVVRATRNAIPTLYEQREFVEAGGLASYGTSLAEAYRQIGIYTGRVLKGENPAGLPIMQSTKFEFLINLKTAKTLGVDVPLHLQQRADEVIE